MQITVKTVEQKTSKEGKAYQRIQDEKDIWYSVWDTNLFGTLEVGKTYEIAYEEKGNFKNINDVKAVSPSQVATPQPAPKPADKDLTIAREVCLKAAVEFGGYKIQAGIGITSSEVILVAKEFEKYIIS